MNYKIKLLRGVFVITLLSLMLFAFEAMFIKHSSSLDVSIKWFYQNLTILCIAYLSFTRFGFFVFYFIICFFSLIQFLHVSYFGRLLLPYEFILFFKNLSEVEQSFLGALNKMWIPFFIFAVEILLGFLIINKFLKEKFVVIYLKYIVVFLIFYKPLHTLYLSQYYYKYVNSADFFTYYGSRSSALNSAYINIYNNLTFIFGKLLPEKLLSSKVSAENLPYFKELEILHKNPNVNIIFVVGESLRYQNMSVFGYPYKTTPFLEHWNKQEHLFVKKMISSSVSTDVSLPMLFNNTSVKDGFTKILSGQECLFKLAKKNGFKTYFVTNQNQSSMQNITNYICPNFIDERTILNNSSEDSLDIKLVNKLKSMELNSGGHFIVLHQRGSHSPYNLRYDTEHVLRPILNTDSIDLETVKHYDNSVDYTDSILNEVLTFLKSQSANIPTYFVFVSDHGESLGENQLWGHVHLKDDYVFSVPFLFWSSVNIQDPFFIELNKLNSNTQFFSHKTASSLLIKMFGYKENISVQTKSIEVSGPDLDGSAGFHVFNFK